MRIPEENKGPIYRLQLHNKGYTIIKRLDCRNLSPVMVETVCLINVIDGSVNLVSVNYVN